MNGSWPQERRELVAQIERLYPADSPHDVVALVGRQLLMDAIMSSTGWRLLPLPVLRRYAELCAAQHPIP